MKKVAVRVEDLWKEYALGSPRRPHRDLRESLGAMLRAPLVRWRQLRGRVDAEQNFWALQGVGFEVAAGEVVGVIGRNGAGKSTLLKILSRITAPTRGRVELHGRVASLLEVGTGFHPELTGRENIFLNGAVLGMSRREIRGKLDEIVDFAEIERFLDTPVKRYSSGMYVRLAFAVAAHLEPEILLVDEVLAVGDAAFQKRCLGRMQGIASSGRTILFVSHNMGAVRRLCPRTVLLENGRLIADGETVDVIGRYLLTGAAHDGEHVWPEGLAEPGVEGFRLDAVRILDDTGEVRSQLAAHLPFAIEVDYRVFGRLPPFRVGLALSTIDGIQVFGTGDTDGEEESETRPPGRYTSRCCIPDHFLNTLRYLVTVGIFTSTGEELARADSILTLTVENTGAVGSTFLAQRLGVVRPRLAWQREER